MLNQRWIDKSRYFSRFWYIRRKEFHFTYIDPLLVEIYCLTLFKICLLVKKDCTINQDLWYCIMDWFVYFCISTSYVFYPIYRIVEHRRRKSVALHQFLFLKNLSFPQPVPMFAGKMLLWDEWFSGTPSRSITLQSAILIWTESSYNVNKRWVGYRKQFSNTLNVNICPT